MWSRSAFHHIFFKEFISAGRERKAGPGYEFENSSRISARRKLHQHEGGSLHCRAPTRRKLCRDCERLHANKYVLPFGQPAEKSADPRHETTRDLWKDRKIHAVAVASQLDRHGFDSAAKKGRFYRAIGGSRRVLRERVSAK